MHLKMSLHCSRGIFMRLDAPRQAVRTLENGSIYFWYRPFEGEDRPVGDNAERFYMVLNPAWQPLYRMVMLGKKKPRPRHPNGKNVWGVVRRIAAFPEQIENELTGNCCTKSRRERELRAPRLLGQGLYSIQRSGHDAHLMYSLDLPHHSSGSIPKGLQLIPKGDYILKIKNPDMPFPPGLGMQEELTAQYPNRLQKVFDDSGFSEADLTELLNYEGTGLLLAAADAAVTKKSGNDRLAKGDKLVSGGFAGGTRCRRREPLLAGSRL
jgi:hypothetical protein